MEQPAEPRALTRAQQARRQRVIDAAMALGAEGGYEAVQMRDVAARAGVAMGTVYRYFSSKDHLVAAGLVYWAEQLARRVSATPSRGATPAARVGEVLDRALRAMARQPKLVAAVFASMASADAAAVACQRQVARSMEDIVASAIGVRRPPDYAERARMIGHVWYSSLVGWINGASDIDRVHDELVVAVGLLLGETGVIAPLDDGAGGSPRGRDPVSESATFRGAGTRSAARRARGAACEPLSRGA